MKTIRPRAWDKLSRKYQHLYAIDFRRSEVHLDIDGGYIIEPFSRGELELFTGLKDKNGKEIYEGDIVQNGAFVGAVRFDQGLACWCVGETPIYTFLTIKDGLILETEVIGNIHENNLEEEYDGAK